MNGRRLGRRLAAAAAVLVLAAWPTPVVGDALGQTFQLPVPLWLYLTGAAVAVVASFVVTALVARNRSTDPDYPSRSIPAAIARPASVGLSVIGMAWWYGAILAGFTLSSVSPLPAVLLWIGLWVGLPILTVLVGSPWPSLSPFRTTHAVLEWLARRIGIRALDVGFRYPPGMARWPAVLLL